jgi:LEA14-like dessication related protein
MTARFSVISFILAVLLVFTSCRDIKEVQCTGVKGFKVNKLDTKGVDADILLGIKNPNSFGFSIYRSAFDVSYSGIYLGKAKLAKRVHIKGNAEEVYSFNLTNDFKNVELGDVMKLLNGAIFKNTIEIRGDLRVGRVFISKKFPVEIKEKVKLN